MITETTWKLKFEAELLACVTDVKREGKKKEEDWGQFKQNTNIQMTLNINSLFMTADVNECLRNPSPCQHICTNSFGSFTCQCHSCYTKVGTKCDLRQCKIGGKCYPYGTVNPSNKCQVRVGTDIKHIAFQLRYPSFPLFSA